MCILDTWNVLELVQMTSGVAQGTILGPTLFSVYVNDIPNVVTSSSKMFAYDTQIYREINNAEDTLALQSDLDCLGKLNKKLAS